MDTTNLVIICATVFLVACVCVPAFFSYRRDIAIAKNGGAEALARRDAEVARTEAKRSTDFFRINR